METEIQAFPAGVGDHLKYYVYRLIDPRNGETFYIGKGKGNRIFQHVTATNPEEVENDADREVEGEVVREDELSLKLHRINDIRLANLRVLHVVHRHGIQDARTAYEVEAALIDAYGGLTNVASGHHSNDRGPMHVQQILDKYSLPVVELGGEKLILINLNPSNYSPDELLDRVRYAWRISRARAEKADYVLAVIHGVVRGIFKPDCWLAATPENFPEIHTDETSPTRSGFKGRIADDETWNRFVGKRGRRLPEELRHRGQNPIRYHNC
ncbi:LEM-3-like GIY-YIG domain-containing protein [Allosediminivita pacifica]|uniref:GIY-YIG domain-containing protein n=1 Tax=Allosediminivita pacifica TaxID=1267769 RepID=A0A2T6ASW5_9RHOB|nr:hypothetical protein [Allosediminivita pacifica]PTX46911.1 hypothetical protein C8N44_11453 [Allosediminivita pacifica]GGB15284.1 hypothetical protein GCM10011324_26840 [Allosediminivita pacifica]